MYQDLIVNNRKTEIDYINGAVATLGKNVILKRQSIALLLI